MKKKEYSLIQGYDDILRSNGYGKLWFGSCWYRVVRLSEYA